MNNLEPILGSETEKLIEKFISQQGGDMSGYTTASMAFSFVAAIIALMILCSPYE